MSTEPNTVKHLKPALPKKKETSEYIAILILFTVMAVIAVLCIVLDRSLPYSGSTGNVPLWTNAQAVVVAIFTLFIVRYFLKKRSKNKLAQKQNATKSSAVSALSEKSFLLLCALSAFLTFVLLIFTFLSAGFRSGWDNEQIYWVVRHALPVESSSTTYAYFQQYPNNLFLAVCLHELVRLSQLIVPSIHPIGVMAGTSCLAVASSVFFITRAAYVFFKDRYLTICTNILFILLIGLSPWAWIPYSDSFGLFFVCLATWSIMCINNRYIACSLFSFFTIIGYAVKPTIIFIMEASFIVFGVHALHKRTFHTCKKLILKKFLVITISICVALLTTKAISARAGIPYNDDYAFPASHFLMMGLNDASDGGYYSQDVIFTRSIKGKRLKIIGNLAVSKTRIEQYGFLGLFQHELRKLAKIFNDGTFSWFGEGNFIAEDRPSLGGDNNLFRSYYRNNGKYYRLFCSLQQLYWLITLGGFIAGFYSTIMKKRKISVDNKAKYGSIMSISLIALILFLLIFECRARYLYLYGGYFVILSIYGYSLWSRSTI